MKRRPSVAMKIAAIFALSIATVVLFFSASATFLMRQAVIHQQQNEIFFYANKIALEWRGSEGDYVLFENNLNIPYYLSYTVFINKNSEAKVLSSNNEFLPVFSDTENKILKYIDEDYYIDGRLSLFYLVSSVNAAVILPEQRSSGEDIGVQILGGLLNKPLNKANVAYDFEDVYVQVSIDIDRDTSKSMINIMPLIFLGSAIPLLILSFFLGLYFVRRSLKPVSEMTVMAQKIGSENLDAQLRRNQSGDEFDILAKTFNELFSRLEVDFKRERQFTSDVSHELRTPLAVILGHANLLRRWGKDDPEQLTTSISIITAESKNMQSIIENLLELSHVENGQISVKMTFVPIKLLFERLASELQIYAPKVVLEIAIPEKLENSSVNADENMLHEVLTILLTNSVRYSTESAHITLSVVSELNKPVVLSVTDDGCGISADALPHVFERFYREDLAHTRTINLGKGLSSGSGLGLAIAKALVTAMNAEIAVTSPIKEGRGSGVTITFA